MTSYYSGMTVEEELDILEDKLLKLNRQQIEYLLVDGYGVACYEDESDEVLRLAIIVNAREDGDFRDMVFRYLEEVV